MSTRNGKIAKLPLDERELVNRWLQHKGSTEVLLEHLNDSTVVKEMLAREFDGKPIDKHNLSAWRRGGYVEWEARQEWLTDAAHLKDFALQVLRDGSETLVERMTVALAGRWASLVMRWDGEPDAKVEQRIRLLGRLNREVLALQQGKQREERLKIARAAQQASELAMLLEQKEKIDMAKAEELMAPATKELMKKFGVDIDALQARGKEVAQEKAEEEEWQREEEARREARAEKRRQRREEERNSKCQGPNSEQQEGTSNIEHPTPNVEGNKEETLNPEPGTLNVEQGGGNSRAGCPRSDEGEIAPSQVVENEGVSRPVVVSSSEVKEVPIRPEPKQEDGMKN